MWSFVGRDWGRVMQFYAHSGKKVDKSDWQTLEEHLEGVALLAEEFAAVFNGEDWARIAGLKHDAGKATAGFQRRLEGSSKKVDHSTFGAQLARQNCGPLGGLLSYVIAGHHGGMPNGGLQEGELQYRLKHGNVPDDVFLIPEANVSSKLKLPFQLPADKTSGFRSAFFTRMIFSCLVDADFLDTEEFCSPDNAIERGSTDYLGMPDLKLKLDAYMGMLAKGAKATRVNGTRQKILQQCRQKTMTKAGFFSLTVPTGGGKTLSSMTFALDRAVANSHRRVIYAIPFTSIIEQNAHVFQQILGKEQVLEHHSNYRESDGPEDAAYNRRRGFASENWDAPVVVTTNVQLFESLFSNKPSRCRKLHNIANSVIVLDEAQAIPTEYLEPCLQALKELVENYKCTVVLCTATQPALDSFEVSNRLPEVEEIIDQPKQLYDDLERTKVQFVGKLTDDDLAIRLRAEKQVLCIVPTKLQARALFENIQDEEGAYHLSTNMYPEHRRGVLSEVRRRLDDNLPCRIISTSLIEAGVDIDLPVVYRAMAGLDSIAQAAGRCNREGLLNAVGELGQVYVYEPEKEAGMPWLKRCASRAVEILRVNPDIAPIGLSAMRRYFELHYDAEDLDKKKILNSFPTYKQIQLARDFYLPFRDIAQEFRFIEDDSIGVVIPANEGVESLIQSLRFTDFPRSVLRKLQPYTVSVRNAEFALLNSCGALEAVEGEIPILRNMASYSEAVGLVVDQAETWDPENLIT